MDDAGPAAAGRALSSPSTEVDSSTRSAVDSVVLLTVDALRGDQPWTGYDRVQTPNLSRLAASSVVYTRAYALANLTTASVNSLLASRRPSEMVREGCIFAKFDLRGSLAPHLRSLSVATFGAHGHSLFAGRMAPSLGFETWRLVKGVTSRLQTKGAVTGGDIADIVVGYIEKERPRNRKTLVWAHFPDPHDSYVTHEGFPPTGHTTRGRYDSEVAYTDAAIGRVLAAIERSGIANRTAVIVTADHGEAFGEHGTVRHGFTLFEEEVHIPLLVHVPGVEPRAISAPRSAIDLAPTIAELLGRPPAPDWKGTSLLADLRASPQARPVIVELPEMRGRPEIRAVIMGNLKVILNSSGAKVFDLSHDAREMAPLTRENPEAKSAIESAMRELGRLEPVKATPCAFGADSG